MGGFKHDCFFSQWLLWICSANPIHTKSPCLTKNYLCYQITLVLTATVYSRQQSDSYIWLAFCTCSLDTYCKFPKDCCLQDKRSHFFTYITNVVHCFVFVVCELKNPSMNAFLSGLESSGWLKHIKAILDTSAFISKVRENIFNGNSNSRTSSLNVLLWEVTLSKDQKVGDMPYKRIFTVPIFPMLFQRNFTHINLIQFNQLIGLL